MTDTPPQAVEVEQQILGAMLISSQAVALGLSLLQGEMFYHAPHRLIFAACAALFEQESPIDQATLCEKLKGMAYLEQAGGVVYVASLAAEVATAANLEYHARIVQDRYVRRQMQEVGSTLRQGAADLSRESAEIASSADAVLGELLSGKSDGLVLIEKILPALFSEIEEASKNPEAMIGLSTGLQAIDSRLCGLQPAELTILAARPSVGKTALALQIAQHIGASHSDKGDVVFFSVEMPRKAIVTRMLSNRTGIEYNRLRTGRLEDQDWLSLIREVGPLARIPLHIDDTGGLSILEARARLRLLSRKRKIALVVVDYLQLMSGKGDNREQEISAISRGLKAAAKEINAPVLALSQMNRAIESRASKMPQLSDLRESGSLEQDADGVIFLSDSTRSDENPQIEMSIAKSRNGPKGSFFLHYEPQFFRFSDLAPRSQQEPQSHWQER